jgi:branched-chain amino acid transport system permease protein
VAGVVLEALQSILDPVVLRNTVIYSSVIALLSLGITLIYMTTRVFNFAHARLALVGAYGAATAIGVTVTSLGITFRLDEVEVLGLSVYLPYPIYVYVIGLLAAMVTATLAALFEYYVILRPLLRRGADFLMLMIATLAYDFILLAVLVLYNTHMAVKPLLDRIALSSTSMNMSSYDIQIEGVRGIFLFSSGVTLLVAAALYLLLFKTTLGIKMRAAIENPSLASVLGINVEAVYAIAWIIGGATAGVAGYIMLFAADTAALKPISATSPADEVVVSAFAGSIVGGITSVFGGIGGGFLIGAIEVFGAHLLQQLTGIGIILKYNKALSMLAVGLTLLFLPEGLAGLARGARPRLPRLRAPRARGR